jgi:hypothetical protein
MAYLSGWPGKGKRPVLAGGNSTFAAVWAATKAILHRNIKRAILLQKF